MKKIYASLLLLFSVMIVFGQLDTTIEVMYTGFNPVIDGIEDELWEAVDPVFVDQNFTGESPTVTAYWKALWDSAYFYVLISVEDDDHYPSWKSGGGWYDYDQPEIYFDLNEELKDGVGASGAMGHWQVQPHFEDGASGVLKTNTPNVSGFRPECSYCYVLTDENYVWEYEFSYDAFTNSTGLMLSIDEFRALEKIGFDVTIIDQDEGITSSRQRKVWSNIGGTAENYINMDDAGTIVLVEPEGPVEGIPQHGTSTLSVYPNPVVDFLNVNMDFDRLAISNMLGQRVLTFENSAKRVNIGTLPGGIYFIQAFKNDQSLGLSKIFKQ